MSNIETYQSPTARYPEAFERNLKYIIAQCGIADPVEACRQIIKTCEGALAAIRAEPPQEPKP